MRIGEILRLVWLNLSQNKFKVILTSIGIIVGSATIMMVIAIGTGGKEEVAEQFANLNAGAIDISYEGYGSMNTTGFGMSGGGKSFGGSVGGNTMPSMGGGSGFGRGGNNGSGDFGGGSGFDFGSIFGGGNSDKDRINRENVTLTEEDMENLLVFVPGLSDATISYSNTNAVEGGELENASYYTIAGVQDNYATLSNLNLSFGSFISESNNEGKEKVCVLGSNVAKEIFGSAADAVDGEIYIDGRPYIVQGVISQMGTVSSGISPDSAIFIPYNTGIKYITGADISPTLTVIAEDVNNISTTVANIESVLLDSYPNTEFTISDTGTKMEAASASNQTLQLLLVAMAVIVFIVGGIGIMNVLFVSVKERTNEIGILKAIGCSRRDILLEFLFEAASISLVGASLGVLLSLGITPVIEMFSVRVELSVGGALLSLLFGVITGSVFGFYPAYKASRLIPVVALNQE
ncbi:MAG: ABC transporter permease [Acetatifactor sp.]